jgi:regulator of protease activity HflC (stomatin/prohibitin superfamily)
MWSAMANWLGRRAAASQVAGAEGAAGTASPGGASSGSARQPGLPRAWRPTPRQAALGLAAVAALALVVQSVVIVPPGHRGVVVSLGKVAPQAWGEGLHLRVPLAQQVELMNVQIQKGEGGDSAASRDLQHVKVTVAINWRVEPSLTPQIYQQVGQLDAVGERLILPAVHEAVKAVVAQFTAEELVTRRTEVRERIREQLAPRLQVHGIVIDSFAITGFSFSKEFEAAIEDKSRAEQQRLKAERDLERIRVEAEQALTRARAEAEALTVKRQAEAAAMRAQRAEITPELLQWETVRRWDGKLPEVVGGGTPVPITLGRVAPAPRAPVDEKKG